MSQTPPDRSAGLARLPRKPRRASSVPVLRTEQGEDPRVVLERIVNWERFRIGISQEELADRVGLDRTYVGGIERGLRNPTYLVLLRLAQVLEIESAQLMAVTISPLKK